MVLLVLTTQLAPLMLLVGASENCEAEVCEYADHNPRDGGDATHSGHSEAVSIVPLFRQNPAIETAFAFSPSRKAGRRKTVCEPTRTKTFCQRRAKTSRRGSLATVLPSQNGCVLLPNLPWTRLFVPKRKSRLGPATTRLVIATAAPFRTTLKREKDMAGERFCSGS
jgi:hypothetical protein